MESPIPRQSANAPQDVARQLSVDLSFTTSTSGVTTAHFRFLNTASTAASIADVYFNDDFDSVFQFDNPEPMITESSGVAISEWARPRSPAAIPARVLGSGIMLTASLENDVARPRRRQRPRLVSGCDETLA